MGKTSAGAAKMPPMNPADVAHVASLINRYVPKKKRQAGIGIEAWLSSTHETLSGMQVPETQWVLVAKTKMPEEDQNDYNKWVAADRANRQSWASFVEFMMKRFIGAVSEVDAYCRLKRMRLPTSEKDLDAVITETESLCELTGFKPVAEFKAVQFISMLPVTLMMQAFGREGGARNISLDEIKTLLRTHYQAKKLATAEPMDVDMVRENVESTDAEGTLANAALRRDNRRSAKATEKQSMDRSVKTRLPSYETFQSWVPRDVYDHRAQNKLCLGCGQDHLWVRCSMNGRPKGRQD